MKNNNKLKESIISCKKCNRLVNFREEIAKKKRKEFFRQMYWGKGVPGFGDLNAKLLILGLAPAAHGANRTGRVFTGDRSASFLFRCLNKAKMSNKPDSISLNDGLKIFDTYITCAIKCVPPGDKPNSTELQNCLNYLKEEILLLKNLKIILALGQIAFESCLNFFNLKKKDYKFKHGAFYKIKDKITIVSCYHPSPRNVNTKRIDEKKMLMVLNSIRKILKPHHKI